MKGTSSVSRQGSLVCPICEVGKLRPSDRNSMRCEPCGGRLSGPMLEELRRISALPDVSGSHACECGHPEMRRLPDGVFHCPACGSEVLPIKSILDPERTRLGSASARGEEAVPHPGADTSLRDYGERGEEMARQKRRGIAKGKGKLQAGKATP